MRKSTEDFFGNVIILAVVCLALGSAISVGCLNGIDMERGRLQREAVEKGHAEYDSTSGTWQWKGTK
jgi:hypothetical protein